MRYLECEPCLHDLGAKETVLGLARDIEFDAVDAGPLENARLLERLAFFSIQLGSGSRWAHRSGSSRFHG